MPLDRIRVGEALREAREAKGLRQSDVARKLGMTGANVSLIEKGQASPIESVEKYATLVGCRLTMVFSAKGDEKAALAARLAALIPDLDDTMIETLSASADIWERRATANRQRHVG